MCLRDEETVHHLLIHRVFVYSVWMTLIARLDMQWAMPWSVEDLFQQWFFRCKFVCGRMFWKFMLYATLWKLWLGRNNKNFSNKIRYVEEDV